MKRRTLIKGLLAAGVTGAVGYTGFTWYDLQKKPGLGSIEEEREFLAYLAETVIPETNSPGALKAGVDEFMIKMLKDFLPHKDVNRFLDGMEDVKKLSQSAYGRRFQDCSQAERELVLADFEDAGPSNRIYLKIQDKFMGKPFIRTLKFMVCAGFAFSRVGATQAFNYEAIPGAYHPNIPMKEGQTSWVLS